MASPPKRVLVIDDQKDERAIQRAMLSHLGYAVEEAPDGEEGLRMARSNPPDLILMDIAMPQLDGVEACRSLRADPATAGVRLLLFTATSGDHRDQLERAGADGVLIKPVDPHDVADAVKKLIGPP